MQPYILEDTLSLIGKKLFVARHIKGEKITAVAANVGVTHPVISLIENGRYKGLSLSLLITLANYYSITLDYLISEKAMVDQLVG